MTTPITRKGQTGEAGNPGEFGSHSRAESAVSLATAGRRTPEEIADDAIDKLSNELTNPKDLQLIRGALEDAAREAQIQNREAAQSDRYAAARKALDEYDALQTTREDDATGYGQPQTTRGKLADALRALIEPPETEETPDEIAARLDAKRDHFPTSGDEMRVLIAEGVRAGIFAAWESWEGNNR